MKKMMSLMLILSLLLAPGLALAQSPVETTHYDLSDIGIAMDVPAGWYTATPATAGNCSLGRAFQVPEAELKAMLSEMDASLYAVCDDFGITQMVVISAPGYSFVNMKDNTLDMDAFMIGFLSNYSNVTDSGVYRTKEAVFAYVRCSQKDATGLTIDSIQFVTNVNGRMYCIQLMSMYGVELNDTSIGLFKTMIDSLVFTGK